MTTPPFASLEQMSAMASGTTSVPPFGSVQELTAAADVTRMRSLSPGAQAARVATALPQNTIGAPGYQPTTRNPAQAQMDRDLRREQSLTRNYVLGVANDLFDHATALAEWIPSHLAGQSAQQLQQRNINRTESKASARAQAAMDQPASALARNLGTMMVELALFKKVAPEAFTPAANIAGTKATTILGRFVKQGALDAATFGTYEGILGTIENTPPEELVNRIWGGATAGATAPLLGAAAGQLTKLGRIGVQQFARQMVENAETQRLAGEAAQRGATPIVAYTAPESVPLRTAAVALRTNLLPTIAQESPSPRPVMPLAPATGSADNSAWQRMVEEEVPRLRGKSDPPIITEEAALRMAPDELRAAGRAEKAFQRRVEREVFGEKYDRWRQLDRADNATYDFRSWAEQQADAAEKQAIEDAIPVEKKARLEALGYEGGLEADDLIYMANNGGNIETFADTPELLQSAGRVLGGERRANDLGLRYSLRLIWRELKARGVPDEEIIRAAVVNTAHKGVPAHDAVEFIQSQIRTLAQAEGASPASATMSAPRVPLGLQTGATTEAVTTAIARTGIGAAGGGLVGAVTTPEDRGKGAAIGAVVGAGLVNLPAAVRVSRAILDVGSRPGLVANAQVEAAIRNAQTGSVELKPGGPSRMPQFNLARWAADPTGQTRIAQEAERVAREYDIPLTARVTEDQTRQMAAVLGWDADALMRTRTWRGPHFVAAANVLADNVKAVSALEGELANGLRTAEDVTRITRQLDALTKQNDAILGNLLGKGSEAGRTLRALQYQATTTLDPAVWFQKAARLMGVQSLPSEVQIEIGRFIEQGDRQGLARYVAELERRPLSEKITTGWKLGLLSSPTTWLTNGVGNVLMGQLEKAKDAPAAMLDYLLGRMTGVRTTTMPGLSQARAGMLGAIAGVKSALTGEATISAKYEMPRVNPYQNPIMRGYYNAVMGILGGTDDVFRMPAFTRSVQDRVTALGLTKGLSREAANAEGRAAVDYIVSGGTKGVEPPDDVILGAASDAEVAVYQNKSLSAGILQGIKEGAGREGGPLGRAATEVLVPFARTPANIGERIVEYAGGGYIGAAYDAGKLLRQATRGTLDAATQRKLVQHFGRASAGSAIIAAGYLLAQKGLVSGTPPQNKGEKGSLKLLNNPSFALKIGDTWHDLRRVAPFGALLAFGASIYDITHDAQLVAKGKAPGALLGTLGTTAISQSAFYGIQQALSTLENPLVQGPAFLNNLAGSVVPSVVARTASGLDPRVREVETPTDAILNRLPVLSRRLPGKIDQLGREVRRNPSGLLASLFGFTNPRREAGTDDPVLKAIAETGASIGDLARRSKVRDTTFPGGFRPENDTEYRERQQKVGVRLYGILNRVVTRPGFAKAPLDRQKKIIEYVVNRVRGAPFRYSASAPPPPQ